MSSLIASDPLPPQWSVESLNGSRHDDPLFIFSVLENRLDVIADGFIVSGLIQPLPLRGF